MALFADTQPWTSIADGNLAAFNLFKNHYTYKPRLRGINIHRFTGPGERLILLSQTNDALFVWRKEKFRQDDQTGVNCAVFRNTGKILSSELITEAEKLAWQRWPNERLFTFVNPKKIKSTNPGCCFKKAGWNVCGNSKARNLLILEKYPL